MHEHPRVMFMAISRTGLSGHAGSLRVGQVSKTLGEGLLVWSGFGFPCPDMLG